MYTFRKRNIITIMSLEMINQNLSKKVRLIGTQTNINEIYNALDLHILSSRVKAFLIL